jgi:thioredoxin
MGDRELERFVEETLPAPRPAFGDGCPFAESAPGRRERVGPFGSDELVDTGLGELAPSPRGRGGGWLGRREVERTSAGFSLHTTFEKGINDMVRAHWNGAVIAESDDTVVIDGNHYFPAGSVNEEYLVTSDTTTVCPWKGRASYYSVEVEGKLKRDAAWYYASPSSAASSIAGRVAFWRGVKIEDEGTAGRRRSLFDRFRRETSVAAAAAIAEHPDDANHVRGVPVADLDDHSFFAALDGHVTIADFWAPWCGPCQQLHPMFDAQAAEYATDVTRFVRVNVDESPGVASAFNIMSIPTIIVFDAHGHEIDREIGVPGRRRLEQLVRGAGLLAQATTGRGAA